VPTKPEYIVERGEIVRRQVFVGRVAPINSQPLHFMLSGRVADVHYSVGDDVQAGDVIAELDASVLQAELLAAQADLEVAQSLLASVESDIAFDQQRAQLQLDLAQLRVDHAVAQASDPPTSDDSFRIRELEIERDVAQLALDEVTGDVDPELALAVRRAEQHIAEIEGEIEETRMIAPMDGRLMQMRFDEGDQAVAFEQIGIIADVTLLEVQDVMSTSLMTELVEGMDAELSPANLPGDPLDGTLVSLPRPFGSGADDSVHIHFNDPSLSSEMTIGERVSVSVLVDEREDVLWLPLAAIRQFGGRDFVVVKNGGIQQRVDVDLGLEGDDRVEILSGLEAGQTVVAA
jgi:macrolide-specific efflux system membrane fusion protein